MLKHRQPNGSSNAYTLIELLIVIFVIAGATIAFDVVRKNHSWIIAVAASALTLLLGALVVVLLYRWSWRRDKQQLARLREQHRHIYRVKELPSDPKRIIKPEGAEIRIGDYGWEARPSRRDGQIHLQGLTSDWRVVWHAPFRPDQIEKVTQKPCSQYDYWKPYWAKSPPPPPCPYPIQDRPTPTMGLPYHSGRYFPNDPAQQYVPVKRHNA